MTRFDPYLYADRAPPEPSPGLLKWLPKARAGFKRNRRLRSFGYAEFAYYFNVYVWEWLNVLDPALSENER